MSTSTVPTVKAQLLSLLSAASALTGVQVVRGHPGNEIENETVIIGPARGNQDYAAIMSGRQQRDETYTVDVVCSVVVVGTLAEAEVRAYELAAAVQETVTDDPHLGLGSGVISWAAPGEFADNTARTDMGMLAEVLVRVDVTARLI